jgi:ribosome maturation factor RimP
MNQKSVPLTSHQTQRLCRTVLDVAGTVLEGTPFVPLASEVEETFGRLSLILFVEKKGGRITLDECAVVSQYIDAPISGLAEVQALTYTLDVSSPGLFRQLKTPRELSFYVGKTVTLKPVDVVESKDTEGRFPIFRLKHHHANTTNITLEDLEGVQHALDVARLPESEGVFLAPPIHWPNSDDD